MLCCPAGVRIDTWVETGTEVTPFYDSLLGKLMVHGKDRPDAVAKMAKALSGTVLGGIPSNLQYLSTIIASEGFHAGAPGLISGFRGVCCNFSAAAKAHGSCWRKLKLVGILTPAKEIWLWLG